LAHSLSSYCFASISDLSSSSSSSRGRRHDYSASAPTPTTTINTAPPKTAIAAAPTSAQTKCAFTNLHCMMQHQDAKTNFTMLHIWDVFKIETGIERSLMR
jgi:hypothetical protein